MQTKLSKQTVYNYIKNFCYDPVYYITEVIIDENTDLSQLPIQFNSTVYYVAGAYCVYNNELYLVLKDGSGSWSGNSISNLYLGEDVRLNEGNLSNVVTSEYDTSRFKKISIDSAITLYEVINERSDIVKMAFNNMANARSYIRDYIDPALYVIKISELDTLNGFLAEWDDHSMTFYGDPQ